LRGDDDGIVTHGRSREFRMHMQNLAQTGSGTPKLTNNIKRLLHDIFHIGPGISPRPPYQARQRQGRYGKFHVIIFLSHILH
jgi:hypothetical protein